MIMRHIDRWLENITHRAIIDGLELFRREMLIARPGRKQSKRLTVGKVELLIYHISVSVVVTIGVVGGWYGLVSLLERVW